MNPDEMKRPEMSLVDVQRAMASAVMMPLTANEEMRATGPDGRAMTEVASSFVAPNSRLSAFERLEIYNRQIERLPLMRLGIHAKTVQNPFSRLSAQLGPCRGRPSHHRQHRLPKRVRIFCRHFRA